MQCGQTSRVVMVTNNEINICEQLLEVEVRDI